MCVLYTHLEKTAITLPQTGSTGDRRLVVELLLSTRTRAILGACRLSWGNLTSIKSTRYVTDELGSRASYFVEHKYCMIEHKPFFYVIEHIPTGKLYMGSKWSNDPARLANPSCFMVEGGYQTSSKIVKDLIRDEGLESFSIKEIILEEEISEQFRSVFEYEVYRLKLVDAGNNPLYINETNGVLTKDHISDRHYWKIREHDHKIKFTDKEKSIYWMFQEYELNLSVRSRDEVKKINFLVKEIKSILKSKGYKKLEPEEVGLPQTYYKWKPEHLEKVIFDLNNNFSTILCVMRKRHRSR